MLHKKIKAWHLFSEFLYWPPLSLKSIAGYILYMVHQFMWQIQYLLYLILVSGTLGFYLGAQFVFKFVAVH